MGLRGASGQTAAEYAGLLTVVYEVEVVGGDGRTTFVGPVPGDALEPV
jgi:hypothetical protein